MSHLPPPIPRPVLPVNFVSPSTYQRRPGIVTALGVSSIIVAVLTGIACFVVIIWSFVMLANTPAPAAAVAPTPQSAPPELQSDSLNGLSKSKRSIVMLGLTRARSLKPQRMKQIDALLARSGRLMFPLAGQSFDAKFVRNNVTESGVLPSAKNPSGADGPTFYIIGTGRLEIYDDHAVFRPTGSSDVVSVNANEVQQDPEDQAVPIFTPVPTSAPVKDEKPLAVFLMIESLASAALAIYLFVVGIFVLRNTLASRKLHWIYVWIKLPLAALAIAATARLSWAYGQAAYNGAEKGMAIGVMIAAILGILYPVILMVVLKSRGVKDYYVQAKEDALARGV
jgi:hypothetical protein